jgi:hypothetical protein
MNLVRTLALLLAVGPNLNGDTAGSLRLKVAELQGSLAVVDSKIEFERKRWQDANATINALTNNRTLPVRRNSSQHVQMYQAQLIMKQVEEGAQALKEEKARLEGMIKSLQQSMPENTENQSDPQIAPAQQPLPSKSPFDFDKAKENAVPSQESMSENTENHSGSQPVVSQQPLPPASPFDLDKAKEKAA